MTLNDVTGVITALTALAIAVGGVITAVKLLTEVRVGNAKTSEGIATVHHQLNSATDAANRYQQDLRDALQAGGVTIPPDQSLRTPDEKAGHDAV